MDSLNPYEPPKSSTEEVQQADDKSAPSGKLIYVAWVTVCVLNLPMPLRFAWPITESSGRFGMSIAVVALLAAGCWICAKLPKHGVHLLIGAVPVALSQLLPIAQLVAGGLAVMFGQAIGLVNPIGDDGNGEKVASEPGGFILTLITGAILMMLSAVCGFLLQRFIPNPWQHEREEVSAG